MRFHDIYQAEETISQMRDFFSEEAFLQLPDFLLEDESQRLESIFENISWYREEVAGKCRRYRPTEITSTLRSYLDFFQSTTFLHFLEQVTDMDLEVDECEVLAYGPEDFESIDLSLKEEDCIEVIFDLTASWEADNGGILTYISDDTEIFYLTPGFNSLTIVAKPDELYSFTSPLKQETPIRRIRMRLTPIER